MELKRVFDILNLYKKEYSELEVAFAYKKNKVWEEFSASDYYNFSHLFACGLLKSGLKKGDKILSMSQNLPHWNIADMGICLAGLIHVPIYTTLSSEEMEYIIKHSDAKVVLVSDESLYKRIIPVIEKINKDNTINNEVRAIYTFHDIHKVPNWIELIKMPKEDEEKYMSELEKTKESISENDLHTIIYTSGTTGTPKGVMISHKNILSNAIAVKPIIPVSHGQKALSFLPLCHIYERMLNYAFQIKGISIYYAESLGTIVNDLQDIKPHIINAVPRLLEKFYDKIIAKGKELKGIKKTIFFWAVRLGVKYNERGKNSAYYNFKLKIARKLVFSKWLAAFGGNIVAIVSGGASLQPRLAKLYTAAGLRICEGYGLSETSPVLAVNWPNWNDSMIGTVGPVLEGVQIKIADDGEILAKGPNIMLGYYKNENETKNVIDEDGWFHTGDIGEFVENRFLKITDRKKEIFKTSSGKYIAPQIIENKFKTSSLIEQLMIVGENEKFVSALISPNFNSLHYWASKNNITFRDNSELIKNQLVLKKIQSEIDPVNKTLGEHERIKRFRLVCEEWSQITGELSPTLKLRRNVIYTKYENILTEIYGHGADKTENIGKEDIENNNNEITQRMRKLINIGNNL